MGKFNKSQTMGGLVLTRKVGQVVLINMGEIRIEVIDIKGQSVRLKFCANKEIAINRAEATLMEKKPDQSNV